MIGFVMGTAQIIGIHERAEVKTSQLIKPMI
jgi:hypothetical protein